MKTCSRVRLGQGGGQGAVMGGRPAGRLLPSKRMRRPCSHPPCCRRLAPAPLLPAVAPYPVVNGFNSKRTPLTGTAGTSKQLAFHSGKWSLNGRLAAGPSAGTTMLDQLTWKWSKEVVATVDRTTRSLSVKLSGSTVSANGKTVSMPYGSVKVGTSTVRQGAQGVAECSGAGRGASRGQWLLRAAPPPLRLPAAAVPPRPCRRLPGPPPQAGYSRRVELVQTGATVVFEQPWVSAEGKWAPWINVEMVLTSKPTKTLVGSLGATLPATVGAWKARTGSVTYAPLVRRL